MIKFYLVVEICRLMVCNLYEHHDHQTKEIQLFDSLEECIQHAREDAQVLDNGRLKITRAACIPLQGA